MGVLMPPSREVFKQLPRTDCPINEFCRKYGKRGSMFLGDHRYVEVFQLDFSTLDHNWSTAEAIPESERTEYRKAIMTSDLMSYASVGMHYSLPVDGKVISEPIGEILL